MILHGIQAHNFMSLRDCQIDELDNHLNFLVGPNGSGKSTIFRALKAIRDTLSSGKPAPFNQLCTRGVNPQEVDLTLDVEFNTDWEQELITAFLCASLSRPYEVFTILTTKLPNPSVNNEGAAAFSNWLLSVFRPEALPFLFRGKLHLSYRSQHYTNLQLNYTFNHEGFPITITLRPADSILISGNKHEDIPGGYSPTNSLVDFFQGTINLQDVADLLKASFSTPVSFDSVACLQYLAEKKIALGIDTTDVRLIYLPAQRRFAELSNNMNLANQSNRSFTFSYVLQLILQHAFVFTNNLRVPVSDITSFDWEKATQSNISLDDERQIPLLLYRLKNGDLVARERFLRIQESFKKLVGDDLGFDIHVDLSKEPPALSLDIQITDPGGEIPLTYHGSGIWEALMLSTILDESEGRIVLLDEPAANLHPGMQHKLVEVLHTVPGQVIVVTHSAHMLPTSADDFYKVRRMQRTSKGTSALGLGNSTRLKMEKIEKELHKSSDLAGLLFTNGVVLVEGETEIGALDEWFPKSGASRGKTFSDLNIALHWVGGKPNFPFYLRFLAAFGIPWVIICDGDALAPDRDRNIHLWNMLKELGLIENIPCGASFEELKAKAGKAHVFTANASTDGKFESIPDVKSYTDNNWVPAESKAQKGRYIAQHIPCPKEIEEILELALQQLKQQSGL